MTVVDRWYQAEAVEAVGPYVTRQITGNPLIGLPTGTGKGNVIARINQRAMQYDPSFRILNLTHSKTLVEQNALRLQSMWPDAPIGVCSAGLNRRDTAHAILFAGMQSAVSRVEEIGFRDLIVVDEAQIVSDDANTQYGKILAYAKSINPNVVMAGLSATLYRMRMGSLLNGSAFSHIAYDLTHTAGFNQLLSEGYLARLVAQPTTTTYDVNNVRITKDAEGNYDYSLGQLQRAVDLPEITKRVCDEMVARASDRNCWLVFACGVQHAEHVAEELRMRGISAEAVHSKRKDSDEIIEAYKRGEIRCLVNYGFLTTGFDHPPIDFIGMLRPTQSPILWVQMLGRGTRPYNPDVCRYLPGFNYIKHNCLVLDFAGNTRRLGPINDPVLPRKPGERAGNVPVKVCPQCSTYNHTSSRFCEMCNYEFPIYFEGLEETASALELIKEDEPEPEEQRYQVARVIYRRHANPRVPMIDVSYCCYTDTIKQTLCFEKGHKAYFVASRWWKQHSDKETPKTTEEALRAMHSNEIPHPKYITAINKRPYPEILKYEF